MGEILSIILLLTVGVFAPATACAASPLSIQQTPPPSGGALDVSVEQYRQHLVELSKLVEACASARNEKVCDFHAVGPDNLVALNTEKREVRFDWLRMLITKAASPDEKNTALAAKKSDATNESDAKDDEETDNSEDEETRIAPLVPASTTSLLKAALDRLKQDIAQVDSGSASLAPHDQERAALKNILSGSAYKSVEQKTAKSSLAEKINNIISKFFVKLASIGEHSPWLGQLLTWGFVLLVATGVIWGVLQAERRWRIRIVPDMDGPAPGAASARDWQLWLEDARKAATEGQWREAIHFLYWASISRLESWRLWPADRARTPREYLALVAGDDPRKTGLTTLTRSFERTWYGGRPASENDYKQAEEITTALLSKSPVRRGRV